MGQKAVSVALREQAFAPVEARHPVAEVAEAAGI
jgi:hypothetical protein